MANREENAADKLERPASGAEEANNFKRELAALLKRLPPVPVLPDSAFSRDGIYVE
jgi:hypothetical protein